MRPTYTILNALALVASLPTTLYVSASYILPGSANPALTNSEILHYFNPEEDRRQRAERAREILKEEVEKEFESPSQVSVDKYFNTWWLKKIPALLYLSPYWLGYYYDDDKFNMISQLYPNLANSFGATR
ncbi:hypothetical protein H4R33_002268 [Dimargaris cristalligena]|uniref:Uncharacterized protein n=1 Tax=Dimargaris cristalligena TaxID=215637 RepID=A0A4Q0A1B9_9FUNG|nr:hypothetical protein H4R33_002268 [Dimargaris cristalligena]RKP39558.1 hypothetical protein BJ085DRAFT_38567 [Dimargaris cristalligena]|eukprot:RKP39558.1 hypothetical protein BJ085DRAFT_38567 [Dimargaris cristalligena]